MLNSVTVTGWMVMAALCAVTKIAGGRYMKKITVIFTSALMILSLCACTGGGSSSSGNPYAKGGSKYDEPIYDDPITGEKYSQKDMEEFVGYLRDSWGS